MDPHLANQRNGDRVVFRTPDRDSARVTAVMHSLDEASVPTPHVDGVEIDGEEARVRLSGSNGLQTVVRLRRSGTGWIVRDVSPLGADDAAPGEAPDQRQDQAA